MERDKGSRKVIITDITTSKEEALKKLNIHQFFIKFYHILTILPVMLNQIVIIARSKNGKF